MLDHCPTPTHPGITLSTANLNRLIDYPADDMTVTVEAGMTIGQLNKLLAEKRQWLPVDVAWPIGRPSAARSPRTPPARAASPMARSATTPVRFHRGRWHGHNFSGGGRVVK